MNESTVTTILEALEKMAAEKQVIGPDVWMEAASKINVLLQGEQETKNVMEHQLAKQKAEYLKEGKTAAYAKAMIEAEEGWLMYRNQVALIDRALETVRLAKTNARLSGELMRNSL